MQISVRRLLRYFVTFTFPILLPFFAYSCIKLSGASRFVPAKLLRLYSHSKTQRTESRESGKITQAGCDIIGIFCVESIIYFWKYNFWSQEITPVTLTHNITNPITGPLCKTGSTEVSTLLPRFPKTWNKHVSSQRIGPTKRIKKNQTSDYMLVPYFWLVTSKGY